MEFDQQLIEIKKIQKEFGDDALEILLGLDFSDAILMNNKGIKFLSALLKEVEKDGEKKKYHAFVADDFTYVTSRIDDNAKQQLNHLINKYLKARKEIDSY